MSSYRIPAGIVAAALMVSPALATAPITGKWLTTERDSIIEIVPCETAERSALCGKVFRVLKAAADGKAMLDYNNPAPALRNRPIRGINVLTDLVAKGTDWRGNIYDPKSGKNYKSIVTRRADGNLIVQGCVAFICKSFVWTPVR